ncbi:hypothetical protein GBA52_027285 [Prunus armeniaca]|nr:hypothetical protein GBA52_027285 [Prunus armeniaca]
MGCGDSRPEAGDSGLARHIHNGGGGGPGLRQGSDRVPRTQSKAQFSISRHHIVDPGNQFSTARTARTAQQVVTEQVTSSEFSREIEMTEIGKGKEKGKEKEFWEMIGEDEIEQWMRMMDFATDQSSDSGNAQSA